MIKSAAYQASYGSFFPAAASSQMKCWGGMQIRPQHLNMLRQFSKKGENTCHICYYNSTKLIKCHPCHFLLDPELLSQNHEEITAMNYFEFFGLQPRLDLDLSALQKTYISY